MMHTLHDLLDSRFQCIGINHLFHVTIAIYVSDATDHIPDSETDMTLP
jgi:hypothetical protein